MNSPIATAELQTPDRDYVLHVPYTDACYGATLLMLLLAAASTRTSSRRSNGSEDDDSAAPRRPGGA